MSAPIYYLHITSIPDGEAPEWVRQQWVGLRIPLMQETPIPVTYVATGILSSKPQGIISKLIAQFTGKGKTWYQPGYLVETTAAFCILESSSPKAAMWWKKNTPELFEANKTFIFDDACGYVTENVFSEA